MNFVRIALLAAAVGCVTTTDTTTKDSDSGHSGMTMTTETPTPTTTDCYSCTEFLTSPTVSYTTTTYYGMCPDSAVLYAAVSECACVGACAAACGDSACAGETESKECLACMGDAKAGCGDELGACLADL